MKNKKIQILSTITTDDFLYYSGGLTTDEKVDLAFKLDEEGDLTYELKLMEKLMKLTLKMYKPGNKEDVDMGILSTELKKILPLLTKINDFK
jgi:hypothetical protein